MADVMNEVLLLDMLNINYNFSHIFIELKQFIHAGNRPSQTLIQKLSTKLNTYGICRYNNFYERATNQRIDIDIMELISTYSVMLDTNILKIMMSLDNKNVDIIMEKYENKICYDLIKIFDNNTSGYTRYILNKYKINLTEQEWDTYLSEDNLNIVFVNKYLERKEIIMKQSYIENIAKHLEQQVLEKALAYGGIFNESVLENACLHPTSDMHGKYLKVQYILDNKIEPTQKAYKNIISFGISDRYSRYKTVDNKTELLINLLCDYGYIITYDDLKLALERYIIIPNIERFNIVFDNTYLLLCSKLGFTPYKVEGLVPDISCLQYECEKTGNIHKIRNIISSTNLVPDNVCMKNICSTKTNSQTLKYLADAGGKIDIEAFKKYIEVMNNSKLTSVFEYFIAHNNIALKEPEKKLEKEPEKEPEKEKEPEIKKIQSQIPKTFSYRQIIYENINNDIKKCLKLTKKHQSINYIDFRRIILDYVNENKMINKSMIELKEPFLFGTQTNISFSEINEWIYHILFTNKTKVRKGIKT